MKKKERLRFKIEVQRVEIERLREDVRALIDEPDSLRATTIKISHDINKRIENTMWSGDAHKPVGVIQFIPCK